MAPVLVLLRRLGSSDTLCGLFVRGACPDYAKYRLRWRRALALCKVGAGASSALRASVFIKIDCFEL